MPLNATVEEPPKHAWSLPGGPQRMTIAEEASRDPASFTPVLTVTEAERYVEELKEFGIEEVGSSR